MVWTFGALTTMSLLWCGLAAWMLLRSLGAPGPGEPGYGAVDPHGYVAIVSAAMLVVGVPALAGFALAWRLSARRVRGLRRLPR